MNTPDAAILGMGYLGRPLAEKLFENGGRVSALKRSLTSDDINLPIELDAVDLNDEKVFQTAFWRKWADKEVWICLLPPSAVGRYTDLLAVWGKAAKQFGVRHIVYASSTSVYGEEARECTEHNTLQPQTASAQKVLAAERLLLESGIEHVDILRLGGLYSAERHPLNSLLKSGKKAAGMHRPVNMLHRSRAVAALYLAACTPSGLRIRNIVEKRHLPKHEFYRAEAVKLGLPELTFDETDCSSGKIVNTAYDDFSTVLD